MARVYCDDFANGYRWAEGGRPRDRSCTLCGVERGGVSHQFFGCPGRGAEIARLRAGVEEERRLNERKWRGRRDRSEMTAKVIAGRRKWPKVLDDRLPWWPAWGDKGVIGEYPHLVLRFLAAAPLFIYKWHRGGAASARLSDVEGQGAGAAS